ncbi:hypothetical protein B0H66DRAFT_39695 [Apodospora peruviana]|uniref:Uncharacterized protein n=1 Tax=Apodospora peruviana TaxID=516989 RepID=A0AAE0IRX9_9PEZI|nr:hypothetical protein B0H66DRAFT_39695 [Apodospora peruviana]
MPRHPDPTAACFVELASPDDDAKCAKVQCIYCNETRAKNTTRQKQHLTKCQPYLAAHPEALAALQAESAPAPTHQYSAVPVPTIPGVGGTTNLAFAPNQHINGTAVPPAAMHHGTHLTLPTPATPEGPPAAKKQKKQKGDGSGAPDISRAEVHAAFEEFQKPGDKCMAVRCRHCNNVRAKNTSRQREHLMGCLVYQQSLGVNHTAVQRIQQGSENNAASLPPMPAPTAEFDFRITVKISPVASIGTNGNGQENWMQVNGGDFHSRSGNGTIHGGGYYIQTTCLDSSKRHSARFLIKTQDRHTPNIVCKVDGRGTGDKQHRVSLEMQTSDEQYANLNTGVWIGNGRINDSGTELVYDAFRVS